MPRWQICSLCQFHIVYEDIIKDDEEHKYVGLLSLTGFTYFQSIWELHCLRRCHRQCLDLITPSNQKNLWKISEATKYNFMPSARQLDIRCCKIRSFVSTRLFTHFSYSASNLPLELWEIVADYLIPEYVTVNVQRLWKPPQEPSYANITSAIWCKYVDFEGTRYMSEFSNEPTSDDWELIFEPSDERVIDIYSAENHFGITRLLFSGPHTTPTVEEAEGIWWRKNRVDVESLSIRASSDGIKLRRLTNVDGDHTAWSVPKSNSMRFANLSPSGFVKRPDRMASLVCNRSTITGYSVLWEYGLAKLFVHQRGEAGLRHQSGMYKSWMHMPIDPGETITEIWMRESLRRRDRALGFKTNTGRVFIAGISNTRCSNWILVDRPIWRGEILLDCSNGELSTLAFESDKPARPESPFPIPKASEVPSPNPIEDFFYSSHSLTGLVKVTPCKFVDREGYSGMLLYFSTGHRESVDLDRSDTSLFLVFKRRIDLHPYVAEITNTPWSTEMEYEPFLELFCDGRLEWWWSRHQAYVIYNGQKSLSTV
ncbi:hypothetical protein HDV63DRAFT_395871 [Trichoderma sp. SZMC 28014]